MPPGPRLPVGHCDIWREGTSWNVEAPFQYSTCPVIRVVSIGRCNTRRKSQVQEFQGLRIIREHKSKEKASCLGKSELQPKGSVRLKRIARSNVSAIHRPT